MGISLINKIRVMVFLSGFISLELEILGTRIISPIFGPTIYVWTSLICVTLTMLAIGYYFGGKLADKGKVTVNVLGLVILFIGIYMALLPFTSRFILYNLYDFGIVIGPLLSSLLIFLFPMIFLGFIVPSSVKFITKSLDEVGGKAGEIYSLATIGSIVGAFTTGFYLILYLGVAKTSLITGIILILLSILIIKSRLRFLSLLLIPLLLIIPSPSRPVDILESFDSYYGQIRVTEYKDSVRLNIGMITQTSMNNKTMKNEVGYSKKFRIPFIYNPNYKDVLMIGFGGGYTAKGLVEKYSLNMDVVEIEPKMLDLAIKYFYWEDEARVYFDDARHFLKNSGNYDVIFIDIGYVFSSWNLYTLEAFEVYDQHLNPDGMLVINLISAVEGEHSRVTQTLHKTLKQFFRDIIIFRNTEIEPEEVQSLIIYASKVPIDKDKFISSVNVSEYLGYDIEKIMNESSRFSVDADTKLTTDDHPVAELYDYTNWEEWGLISKSGLEHYLP